VVFRVFYQFLAKIPGVFGFSSLNGKNRFISGDPFEDHRAVLGSAQAKLPK
jgi:hypothetical protein